MERRFAALDEKVRRKALRRGVTKGCRMILDAARRRAPMAKGALRVSLGMKVSAGRRGVSGRVGPRKGVFAFWARKRAAPLRLVLKGTGIWLRRRPSLYAHQLEEGHGGPHPAAPHPFLRPAAEESRAGVEQVIKTEIQGAVQEAIRS